jgi:hypothetical protein
MYFDHRHLMVWEGEGGAVCTEGAASHDFRGRLSSHWPSPQVDSRHGTPVNRSSQCPPISVAGKSRFLLDALL